MVGVLVELFGRSSGGARCQAGGRRHVLLAHISWRIGYRGDHMGMCGSMAWKWALQQVPLVHSRERLRHGKYGSANHTHAWQCSVSLDMKSSLSS